MPPRKRSKTAGQHWSMGAGTDFGVTDGDGERKRTS